MDSNKKQGKPFGCLLMLVMAAALIGIFFPAAKAEEGGNSSMLSIQNERLRMEIDVSQGAKLVGLYDLESGRNYFPRESALFSALVRHDLRIGGYQRLYTADSREMQVVSAEADGAQAEILLQHQGVSYRVLLQADRYRNSIAMQVIPMNGRDEAVLVRLRLPAIEYVSVPSESGDVYAMIPSEIGSMGIIERENATILNAALWKVAEKFTEGFAKSLQDEGINNAAIYLSQNDGTLMTMEYARRYPILTVACGPTNSIRGASYLSTLKNAIVIDVGGTTTDVGAIQSGFPRESSVAVTIGGIRTNFRMPDVLSIGLGGGSIVREQEDGRVTVGPDSVGYELESKALVFGGDVMTATDIAVRLGMVSIGDASKVEHIPQEMAKKALNEIRRMTEDAVDAIKVSNEDCDVILVGGGSVILPSNLAGASKTIKPEHFGCANAIGSAISKVSGTYEKLINYDEIPREEALENAKQEAIQLAVDAGAVRETVEIIDLEDVPLAYYPGNTNRVKIKAAGELSIL